MASEVTDRHVKFFSSMGADLRALREKLDMSQQEICDLMGWGRFAMSKIETGKTNLSLFDYLRLISLLEAADKEHPAFAVMRKYGGRKALTTT